MLNKIMIIGNLGRDPEVKEVGSNTVCKFAVATSEKWKDKTSGEKKEETTWHDVVVWGTQAKSCGDFLSKGRQVYVEGRLKKRQYDDKDGNKRTAVEIVADNVRFLGGKGDSKPAREPGDEDLFG